MAKKKTKRNKILIPRIKELQTTPDLSLINPILEDNTIICLHGGRVQLKAKNAKRIKSENIPLILNNEIQGASIIGCPNPPILGGPCTKVTLVFPYTLTQHKINNKRAVLQMGLIGVSNKGYPILGIPKKNKIQFSPLKLPSNPLPKIEYQRNQWEGIGEIQKSNKVNKKAEIGNNISSVVQDEIPPNVIRIETQDDSGEFIEIELPPTASLGIDDPPLQDVSAMFIPALRGVGSAIKGIKNVAGIGRSLTLNEVLEIVNRLEKGRNENRRLVKSKQELDELWKQLTKNARELEPKADKRHGKPIYRRELDDGTIIQYKEASTSGGEAIEIHNKNPYTNKTIHIKQGG